MPSFKYWSKEKSLLGLDLTGDGYKTKEEREREKKKSHLIKVKEQVLFLDSPAIFCKL